MVTFGSPKAGNKTFSEFYNAKVPDCYRFVFKGDAIPRLIFQSRLLTGYHHVGRGVVLKPMLQGFWERHNPGLLHKVQSYLDAASDCQQQAHQKYDY